MQHIELLLGDITKACCSAIVNAANPQLSGGGGVDDAIHRAAGPQLLQACSNLPVHGGVRCAFGEARITPAFALQARYVIHAVGPIYHYARNPAKLLASAYRNALQLAVQYRCESVALPAISCGVYGYPHAEAAQVALTTAYEAEFKRLALRFYLFNDRLLEVFAEAAARLSKL